MVLSELFKNIPDITIPGEFQDLEVSSICADSREVGENSLFICLSGEKTDGANFIDEAISKGATAILMSSGTRIAQKNNSICFINVADTNKLAGQVLEKFFDNPSKKVKTIGVTGTNGKTTVTYLCESIFKAAGKTCGIMGTIGHRYGDQIFKADNTTPGVVENYQYLSKMVDKNIDYCLMEVSSHALDQGRVDQIHFHCALFTNLTSDHLDYHRSREEYSQAKGKLFSSLEKDTYAVINTDDPFGDRLIELTQVKVLKYGLERNQDVSAKDIHSDISGTSFTLVTKQGEVGIRTYLVGMHNVYNILASAAVCLQEGLGLEEIKEGAQTLKCIPGRLESIQCGQDFHVFLDYAHTEDALKNVLTSLRAVCDEEIILIFGCGGDRDKGKRSKMGKVASELANVIIITNDNPRTEDPQAIVDQIISGCVNNNIQVILDRKEAINKGIHQAKSGNIVLVAGKGHEDYQIFRDETIPFNEHEIIKDFLNAVLVKGN